jgi:hypothetical protein
MIGDSIRKLKVKGAQMTKVLTASVVLALLFSLTANAQNKETARGTNKPTSALSLLDLTYTRRDDEKDVPVNKRSRGAGGRRDSSRLRRPPALCPGCWAYLARAAESRRSRCPASKKKATPMTFPSQAWCIHAPTTFLHIVAITRSKSNVSALPWEQQTSRPTSGRLES